MFGVRPTLVSVPPRRLARRALNVVCRSPISRRECDEPIDIDEWWWLGEDDSHPSNTHTKATFDNLKCGMAFGSLDRRRTLNILVGQIMLYKHYILMQRHKYYTL